MAARSWRRGAPAGAQDAELQGPRCTRTAHDGSVRDTDGRRPIPGAADGPRAAARRYRHPGDVIRLIAAAVVLAVAGAVAALVPSALLRPDAAEVSGTGPGTAA